MRREIERTTLSGGIVFGETSEVLTLIGNDSDKFKSADFEGFERYNSTLMGNGVFEKKN